MLSLHFANFLVGFILAILTLLSAVRTLLLPRSSPDVLSRVVFIILHYIFTIRIRFVSTYLQREHIMSFYAPISLLLLLSTWLLLILVAYMSMFLGLGIESWYEAFKLSGSSLFTLGIANTDNWSTTMLVFSEAALGLILVALLIAYLPTMYSAFSRREATVTMLEVWAGAPPSAVNMILRFKRLNRLDSLQTFWEDWEQWFTEIEENHTSFPALVFFRSPQSDHSWVTAAGTVLDAAALAASTLDIPRSPHAELCSRAGYLALRRIADNFAICYHADPFFPGESISITREEFDRVSDRLAREGIPLKPNRDQAWRDFAGWRVNYDTVLLALCALTMAPPAPWSSDKVTTRIVPFAYPTAVSEKSGVSSNS